MTLMNEMTIMAVMTLMAVINIMDVVATGTANVFGLESEEMTVF